MILSGVRAVAKATARFSTKINTKAPASGKEAGVFHGGDMMIMNESIYKHCADIGKLHHGWGYLLFTKKLGEKILCVFSNFPKITFIQIGNPNLGNNFEW